MRYHELFWAFSWQAPKQLLGVGVTPVPRQDSVCCEVCFWSWALSSVLPGFLMIFSILGVPAQAQAEVSTAAPFPAPSLLSRLTNTCPLGLWNICLWLTSSPRLPGYISVPSPLWKSQNQIMDCSWDHMSCLWHGGSRTVACIQALELKLKHRHPVWKHYDAL